MPVKRGREGDTVRMLRANPAEIGHFHTADNPGRNERGESQNLTASVGLRQCGPAKEIRQNPQANAIKGLIRLIIPFMGGQEETRNIRFKLF